MFWAVAWMLIIGHAVGDYVLQSDTMAKSKNRFLPNENSVPWYYWLAAHSLTHGGLVTILTGSVYLGFAETVVHFVIDILKVEKITDIHIDQLLHIVCKFIWAGIVTFFYYQAM